MNKRYEDKIVKLTYNYELLKKDFVWEIELSKYLVALNYVIQDKAIDTEYIKSLNGLIKDKTKMFSPFRGPMQFMIAGLLTSEYEQAEAQFDKMLLHKETLKCVGFKHSTYVPTALYALLKCEDSQNINSLVEHAKVVYDEMKSNHPFLTSGDDYALAILIANTKRNPDILEIYYKALSSEHFSKTNGLQMLSHILSFSDKDIVTTVRRCVEIRNTLKKNKMNIASEYYPAIGLMALLEDEEGKLLEALIEMANKLCSQKGYKWLGKGMNVMIASALIAGEYVKDQEESVVTTTLQVSIQSIIAAQQAAFIATISASTAVATSS